MFVEKIHNRSNFNVCCSRADKYENGDTNGLNVLNNVGHHLQNPELVDLMDDGIDIVRIKTTEEVRPPLHVYFMNKNYG